MSVVGLSGVVIDSSALLPLVVAALVFHALLFKSILLVLCFKVTL